MDEFCKNLLRIVICFVEPDAYATHAVGPAAQENLPAEDRPNGAKRWGVAVRYGSWVEKSSAGGSEAFEGRC